jgi:hypothetical protein
MSNRNQSRGGSEQLSNQSAQALQKSLEVPFNQLLNFQKVAAEVVRGGLEMSNWAQSRNIEVTKETLNSYIDMLDRTTRETEKMAQKGVEQFRDITATQQQIGQRQFGDAESQFDYLSQQFQPQGQQASPGFEHSQVQRRQPQRYAQAQQAEQPQHAAQQFQDTQQYLQPHQQTQQQPQPSQQVQRPGEELQYYQQPAGQPYVAQHEQYQQGQMNQQPQRSQSQQLRSDVGGEQRTQQPATEHREQFPASPSR